MAENEKKTAETTEEVKAEEKKTDKKPEKLDGKGLTAKGKENEAIEAAMEAEEEEDDGDLILEDTRVSVEITAENTKFSIPTVSHSRDRTVGGRDVPQRHSVLIEVDASVNHDWRGSTDARDGGRADL